jgi:hypothetical protein
MDMISFFQEFPKSIATSVNNVAVHGVPDSRPLEEGDLVHTSKTFYYFSVLFRQVVLGQIFAIKLQKIR